MRMSSTESVSAPQASPKGFPTEADLAELERLTDEAVEYSALYEAARALRSPGLKTAVAVELARRKLARIRARAEEMDRFKRTRRENGQFAPAAE